MKEVFASVPSSILSIEGRYWRTIRDFFRDPKKMVKDYAAGKRKTYASPVQFFFVFASILMLLQYVFYGSVLSGLDIKFESTGEEELGIQERFSQATAIIVELQSTYKNYFELGIPVFLGLLLALIYRRTFNLAESFAFSFYALAFAIELSGIILLVIPDMELRDTVQSVISVVLLLYFFYFLKDKYRPLHAIMGPISMFLATTVYGAIILLIILIGVVLVPLL